MAEIRFREASEPDLELILSFSVAQFGRNVAIAYLDSFEAAWALLSRHPQVGAVFRGGKVEVRSYPCRTHRIFYTLERDIVWVSASSIG